MVKVLWLDTNLDLPWYAAATLRDVPRESYESKCFPVGFYNATETISLGCYFVMLFLLSKTTIVTQRWYTVQDI